LDRSKFGANLNPFEINLIRFENRIGRSVLPTPPVSAARTASPRCPVPHPDADDPAPSCLGPPVSHVDRVAPTPAALHCRAAARRPQAPRPGRCCTDATSPHCARPSLSPSLSPTPPPHGAHPSSPSLPAASFKTEPPPPVEFSPPPMIFPSPPDAAPQPPPSPPPRATEPPRRSSEPYLP
jgi:hypothetical protein